MSRPVNRKVLGVDPGLASTGWGVVEKFQISDFKLQKAGNGGSEFQGVDYGVIVTKAGQGRGVRLKKLYKELYTIIKRVKPDMVAVEELFFGKNVKTAMMVGQAQGVIMLAAASLGIKVCLLSPLQVKSTVVGYGRAEKAQVQELIKKQLGMDRVPRPNHAADALAVALTALVTNFKLYL